MAFSKLVKKTAIFAGAAALVLSTGVFASAATAGAEVATVTSSVADTDAAVPSTAHTVTLLSSSGVAIPHGNPINGATVEYDEETETTTVSFYQKPLEVSGVHGYISTLTLSYVNEEGETVSVSGNTKVTETGTVGSNSYTYPAVVSYELGGDHTSLPEEYSISYEIVYVTATSENPSHRQSSGSLVINAATVNTNTDAE